MCMCLFRVDCNEGYDCLCPENRKHEWKEVRITHVDIQRAAFIESRAKLCSKALWAAYLSSILRHHHQCKDCSKRQKVTLLISLWLESKVDSHMFIVDKANLECIGASKVREKNNHTNKKLGFWKEPLSHVAWLFLRFTIHLNRVCSVNSNPKLDTKIW